MGAAVNVFERDPQQLGEGRRPNFPHRPLGDNGGTKAQRPLKDAAAQHRQPQQQENPGDAGKVHPARSRDAVHSFADEHRPQQGESDADDGADKGQHQIAYGGPGEAHQPSEYGAAGVTPLLSKAGGGGGTG